MHSRARNSASFLVISASLYAASAGLTQPRPQLQFYDGPMEMLEPKRVARIGPDLKLIGDWIDYPAGTFPDLTETVVAFRLLRGR